MVHRGLSPLEKRVKVCLLNGQTANKIAKNLHKSTSTIYKVAERLEFYGEIRPIPGCKNPKVYEDPLPIKESGSDYGYVIKTIPPVSCPDGYVQAHLSGRFKYKVRAVGSFDDIKDKRGFYVGSWIKETHPKGCVEHKGFVNIHNQSITITYREGNRGSQTFSMFPERIFFDPVGLTRDTVDAAFLDRANLISEIMRNTGWQITDPVRVGRLHYPFTNSPLIQHFPKDVEIDGGDLIVDTSHGEPELEHYDQENTPQVLELMANLPTRFFSAESNIGSHSKQLDEVRATLSDIVPILGSISEIQTTQTELLANQVKLSTMQIQISSNLLSRIASGDQRTFDSYFDSVHSDDINSIKTKNKLEGYN